MVTDTKTADRRIVAGNRKSSRTPAASQVPDDSHIARLCVENGLKMTGQRRVIAYVLSNADDHPDVEELYRRASEIDSRISVATVYRTVRLLEEKGILERRDFGGGRARYEASDSGNHYHLIDVDSGRVVELQDEGPARLLAELARLHGFDLVSHRIELFGRRLTDSPESTDPNPDRRNRSGS